VSIAANIGLAETENYTTLIVLRCLQSTGSASTIAIGSGVIGDITTRADRGGYTGFFQAGMLVPIAVGPVIGGAFAGTLGWRAIFWFLTIYSIVLLLILLFLLPETLRTIVSNGARTPSNPFIRYPLVLYQRFTRVEWDPAATTPQPASRKRINVLEPFRILISKQALPIILFFAVYFAVWQIGITAMSTLFKKNYGLSEIQNGLTFIANGAGAMIGTIITGKILDKDYRRVQEEYNRSHATESGATQATVDDHNFPLERARFRLIPIFVLLQCLSVLLFGWTVQYTVHIAVPIVATFITGWTSVSTQTIVTTYVVDTFSDKSAAATASLNLARCLFAAGGASFIIPLVNRVGAGSAFTICAGGQLVAVIALVVQVRFAGDWRRKAKESEEDSQSGTV
jgi:predicted MFS family arabinose efflux permease